MKGSTPMPHRILLVDDDPHLLAVLTAEGYAVDRAPDGETAFTAVPGGAYALVILEVVLPGRDGFDVCRELRRLGSGIPILMLTARAELLNKVLGLSLGADDYVTKPFDPRELLARIQALLRRTSLTEYRFGTVHADFLKGKVLRDGRPVNLSAKELQLLRFLIVQRGTTLSREKLLNEVWGYHSAYTRTVDVHVATLRQKLEENPQDPRHIVTVRCKGYTFCG
jgi:two-component system alkaline phosphatase synthesis response regulator PhoP